MNTYDLPSRTYWTAASTTYHEAVPGHHFQLALEMELQGLPPFRTLGFWPQGTAYVEGWALYAELVADEAGLFRSEAERFGMLDGQALRAVRLVVDTGLHAFGWSRQKAFETMVAAGVHPTDASSETDRYIAWPGQALAYLTGRREIQRLRRERERRRGRRLRHSALPRRRAPARQAPPGHPRRRRARLTHPGPRSQARPIRMATPDDCRQRPRRPLLGGAPPRVADDGHGLRG